MVQLLPLAFFFPLSLALLGSSPLNSWPFFSPQPPFLCVRSVGGREKVPFETFIVYHFTFFFFCFPPKKIVASRRGGAEDRKNIREESFVRKERSKMIVGQPKDVKRKVKITTVREWGWRWKKGFVVVAETEDLEASKDPGCWLSFHPDYKTE